MADFEYPNEKHIDSRLTRAPRGRYFSLVTYLPDVEIERVLNHYRDYIESALYIRHDRDKKHTEDDFGVLLKRIDSVKEKGKSIDYAIDSISMQDKKSRLALHKIVSQRDALFRQLHELEEQQKIMHLEKEDVKEAHYHVLIRCFDAHTESAVKKWFGRFRVTETKEIDGVLQTVLINTMCELVDSVGASRDYLTHKNDPDKYQYPITDVKQFGRGWEAFNGASRCRDDSLDIIDRLNSNVSLRRLCKEYGKDFIYHYAQYKAMAREIARQEIVAQNYVDLCNVAFSLGTDTIIDERDFDKKIRIDHAKYNTAVEIITEFESMFELKYQGE